MIAYLKGKIIISRPGFIILEVSGVGYKVAVSPQINFLEDKNEYELFIHHHIKEDVSDLYGFEKFGELELFEKLLSVNGVGPKAAMTIIGMAPSEKIIDAIISEDSNFFQSASGIGKKVAIKIILDLKSKISNLKYTGNIGGTAHQDVYDGLEALGYKKQEIDKIIGKIPAELKSSEEKIRWCLKDLAKN
ncbi:Holliday junction branch migration protein RuvA [Candidatus Berkelbacteria bacterium CG08_land_8_20_14_0_20_39_8]|uniref:Holliday junction branch migration complex subunit RuvA n=1 Tax=Candidatus Berkelbacteria bacterium CG08_land_8_20_14_0_20_39_8 TaxID=1974511 RepID=A0A2M6YCS0_9BACT|nr:MAG: Holliday junction branch migration protein RuvA [Candidatus Berkelbacteria bacterium CG08_land_8_20_14_0_20_39_8]